MFFYYPSLICSSLKKDLGRKLAVRHIRHLCARRVNMDFSSLLQTLSTATIHSVHLVLHLSKSVPDPKQGLSVPILWLLPDHGTGTQWNQSSIFYSQLGYKKNSQEEQGKTEWDHLVPVAREDFKGEGRPRPGG